MSDIKTPLYNLIYDYLSRPGPHALQLGCGHNPRPGWLNTDLTARDGIMPLDVTKRFPLPDACFDHVYSEHMIEHLPFHAGQHMLHECFRVLRSGGVVRTVTPSISFLIRLCLADRSQLEDAYVGWAAASLVPPAPAPLAAFVFNGFVRNWGHQFIYDRPSLTLALMTAGFVNITECKVLQSRHPMLRHLEDVQRLPPGFLELESMVLEATKP
jgi:predicted SAM-dependent methyltransferase